ncbi:MULTISPECIES: PLAT/LH2 domain-containing protein [Pseudoalteromonas]|uniref:PLAT/LH2 domain-containing protein n=1 Tax=Pseudoalteromonas TaxID=53246 RepID=UPI00029A666E|nr:MULTISPECIES: PLAT/LH2 domain-containing protein [Pseudoalteromonas]AUJ68575.1 hypothetical protein PNC201_01150 [Pseudoalteromonas sp. NC201]MCF7515722.1 hypothetical protein [Pseudoalteromonas sp. L7]MCF7527764.1 hypothetical protein [Pseudoalteromonas sp. L23]MCX2768679.1 PLAT/LH2 domain-containing protein [Pseudoalteromonas sp. B530]
MKYILKPLLVAGLVLSPISFAQEQIEKLPTSKISKSVSDFEAKMEQYDYQDEESYIQEYVLEFGNGEPEKLLERASFCQGQNTEYIVTVYTSTIRAAGTDADIKVKINWVGGSTSPWKYLDDTGRDDFEKGSVDDFYIYLPNGGQLSNSTLTINSNNAGDKAGWFVERISVEDTCSGEIATAQFNRWISKSVGLTSTRRLQ